MSVHTVDLFCAASAARTHVPYTPAGSDKLAVTFATGLVKYDPGNRVHVAPPFVLYATAEIFEFPLPVSLVEADSDRVVLPIGDGFWLSCALTAGAARSRTFANTNGLSDVVPTQIVRVEKFGGSGPPRMVRSTSTYP